MQISLPPAHPAVRRPDVNRRHPGGVGGLDTEVGVFKRVARVGGNAESSRGFQEDVRRRLAMLDVSIRSPLKRFARQFMPHFAFCKGPARMAAGGSAAVANVTRRRAESMAGIVVALAQSIAG